MSAYLLLALSAVLGVAVPWIFMKMLMPALESGPSVRNFQGREVYLGLGIVWLVWAGCAIIGGVAVSMLRGDSQLSALPILTLAGPLALVAFSLGMVDDALGDRSARGFRGHLSAMAKGRMTTGGLKLLGISLASWFVASVMAEVAPWGAHIGRGNNGLNAGLALLGGAAIALTSNFVNLTDLRPGRALKVSSVLMAGGVLSTGLLMGSPRVAGAAGMVFASGVDRAVDTLALGLFAFGPIAAVWRYDLGETGMLGDAGANPMGAVAGLLIIAGLPLWALLAYVALLLLLNLASEKISFSALIEGNDVLRRIDEAGRKKQPSHADHLKMDAHEGGNPE
jgi:hypothetical protein